MIEIFIPKLNKKLFCESGENLHCVLLRNNIPIASSCNGDKSCGKCNIRLINGEENLSPLNHHEFYILNKMDLQKKYRLACHVSVNGNITIETTYW